MSSMRSGSLLILTAALMILASATLRADTTSARPLGAPQPEGRVARSTNVTLNPVADTYVRQHYLFADASFGSYTTLVAVAYSPCYLYDAERILLRFDPDRPAPRRDCQRGHPASVPGIEWREQLRGPERPPSH